MQKDLEQRTKQFSLAVLKLSATACRNRAADILLKQLIRSATSVGANYREANRAVSRADFKNKIGTVQKEAAESQYWLELLIDSGLHASSETRDVLAECSELLAIFSAIGKKLKE